MGKGLRTKSVLFVGIISIIACLLFLVGLGFTLKDYFDTPEKLKPEKVVKSETKTDDKLVQMVALGDSLTRGTGDLEGKGYIGNLEILFGEINDFHKKINDVYNIILNGNVGITSGYIDVSIKNMPVIKKSEE